MRALVILVHYFASEVNPKHSSVDESRRDARKTVVERVVSGYRQAFAPFTTLQFNPYSKVLSRRATQVDLRVLTVPGRSLIEEDFRKRFGVGQILAEPSNPRALGFMAHRYFQRMAGRYDWYVYSEDDLLVTDPMLFDKLGWFNRTFGDRRVLAPNRFEANATAQTMKTYIDGDRILSERTGRRLVSYVPDEETLTAWPLGSPLEFRRPRNPHSGWFAITQAQLGYWMSQPQWLDGDCSLVSPLESAATLGLTKTFAVYKPAGDSSGFLEVEHLDSRFSDLHYRVIDPEAEQPAESGA